MTPDKDRVVDKRAGEAVEARRLAKGLSATQFAEAADATMQGLAPLRKGVVKNYADKVRFGVARALDWPTDWPERLFGGEYDLPTVKHDEVDQPHTGDTIDLNTVRERLSPELLAELEAILRDEQDKGL